MTPTAQPVAVPVARVLRSVRRSPRRRSPVLRRHRWMAALLGICAVALGIRFAHVQVNAWDDVAEVQSDAAYYHLGANLLADGYGFVHPLYLHWYDGLQVAGADHPPAFLTVLALPSWLGWNSLHSHLVTSCLIGTATVAAIGLLGRRVGGPRVGLIAAGIAGVYPNLWLVDGALMSESLSLLLGVALTLAAYRAWDQPNRARFVVLGVLLGLSCLTRAEATLLVPLLVVPLAVWAPGLQGWAARLRRAAVANLVALAVVAPWVAVNLARFDHPVTLSTGLGTALAAANCDEVYAGPSIGFWSYGCQAQIAAVDLAAQDRSEIDTLSRRHALRYIDEHLDRVPAVLAARLGRTFGLYAPLDQLGLDRYNDLRPPTPARVGLGLYYLAVAGSLVGAVVLRRQRIPVFPLVVWFLGVAATVLATYGQTRFRAPAEPSLVVLAAVGLAAGFRFLSRCATTRMNLRPAHMRRRERSGT